MVRANIRREDEGARDEEVLLLLLLLLLLSLLLLLLLLLLMLAVEGLVLDAAAENEDAENRQVFGPALFPPGVLFLSLPLLSGCN
jgi:hypothetical protein